MKKQAACIAGIILLFITVNQNCVAQEAKQLGIGITVSGMKIGATTIGNADIAFDETACISANMTYFVTKSFSMELCVSQIKTGVTAEEGEYSGAMGDFSQVPVFLTGRFHFPINKGDGNFYLGAGAGYYAHEFDNIDRNRPAEFFAMNIETEIEDSIGGHFVVGGEFFITKSWAFNLDMKGIFNRAEFTLRNPATETEVRDVALNSFIAGLGARYYFQ